MLEIVLPKEVEALVEANLFTQGDMISDNLLAKFLFYSPEITRIYGDAVAQLERERDTMLFEIKKLKESLTIEEAKVLITIDPSIYKNEDMRKAKVTLDDKCAEIREKILKVEEDLLDMEQEVKQLSNQYWKFRNREESLKTLANIHKGERRF